MKHFVKPECRHGCRFLQITESLWLCPHSAYGEASYLRGAVEQARATLERAGGYDTVLAAQVKKTADKRAEAIEERERARKARLR